jgi:hypothetical protein
VFPATSADTDASTANFGAIPEGALVMLPQSYDTQKIANLALRKVALTLKVYGAYVVDRNYGTPFVIYVENGSGFNLHEGEWNNAVAADLDKIRQSLRQVISTKGFLDGDGRAFEPERNLNFLSMRGPWKIKTGHVAGVYDTLAQAVLFSATAERTVLVNSSSRVLNPVPWAKPVTGAPYRLTARATGGGKLRIQILSRSDKSPVFDSGELADGETATFKWPAKDAVAVIYAISGVGKNSSVSGDLVGCVC